MTDLNNCPKKNIFGFWHHVRLVRIFGVCFFGAAEPDSTTSEHIHRKRFFDGRNISDISASVRLWNLRISCVIKSSNMVPFWRAQISMPQRTYSKQPKQSRCRCYCLTRRRSTWRSLQRGGLIWTFKWLQGTQKGSRSCSPHLGLRFTKTELRLFWSTKFWCTKHVAQKIGRRTNTPWPFGPWLHQVAMLVLVAKIKICHKHRRYTDGSEEEGNESSNGSGTAFGMAFLFQWVL